MGWKEEEKKMCVETCWKKIVEMEQKRCCHGVLVSEPLKEKLAWCWLIERRGWRKIQAK
jgi:hypothetical protein